MRAGLSSTLFDVTVFDVTVIGAAVTGVACGHRGLCRSLVAG